MQKTIILQGNPETLKELLDAMIADSKVIVQVVPTSSKSYYLVIYTE